MNYLLIDKHPRMVAAWKDNFIAKVKCFYIGVSTN